MSSPSRPSQMLRMTRTVRSLGDTGVKRLLVIDDEEAIRVALAKFLRSKGYEVQTAESSEVALDILAVERFQVLLCDVRMPGISGLDLVPRALALDADVAILMLTAVNDAPTATEALLLGAVDYLMKPIELADLEQVIQRALHKRELGIEQRKVDTMIREEVSQRTRELQQERAALRHECRTAGHGLHDKSHVGDLWIAATARLAGLSLVTHDNVFDDTPGLMVIRES